ncbi:unnamed protein product [Victoria cruziana]
MRGQLARRRGNTGACARCQLLSQEESPDTTNNPIMPWQVGIPRVLQQNPRERRRALLESRTKAKSPLLSVVQDQGCR